jgi:uncharacterized protein (TIGR03437 family)
MQSSLYGGSVVLAGILLLSPTVFGQTAEPTLFALTDDVVLEHSPGPPRFQQQSPSGKDGDLVSYTDFGGKVHSMRQFLGVYVVVFIAADDLERFTLAATRRFIDDADRVYAHYREVLGWEPDGEGRLEIGILDIPPGGWARLGLRAMEINSASLVDVESIREIVTHEMAHNFDTLGRFIFSGPDPPHSWTEIWDVFIKVYDLEGLNFFSVRDILQRAGRPPFVDHPAWSWDRCVPSEDTVCGIPNNSLFPVSTIVQGAFVQRIAFLHGAAAVQRAMQYLAAAVRDRRLDSERMSPLQKNDLLLESLGQGMNADVSCYVDEWNWRISEQLRTDLRARYGQNPHCTDADGDGFRPIDGDQDDHNSEAYPGAEELPDNGVDENYNDAVDEVLTTEYGDFPGWGLEPVKIPIPSRILGTIDSLQDGDLFEIYLPAAAHLRVTRTGVVGAINYAVTFYPSQRSTVTSTTFRTEAGRYLVYVYPPLVTSEPGPYDITISIDSSPPQTLLAEYPETTVRGRHRLRVPAVPDDLLGADGLSARFWVEGSGWVGSVPVSSSNSQQIAQSSRAALDWTVPDAFERCSQSYRVQFYGGGVPVSPATRVTTFSTRGVPCLPVDSVVNAASFLGGAVAPGEIVTLFGAGLGPASVVGAVLRSDNAIENTLSDTRVLFDGIPAPLIYVHGAQTSAIVPYAVAGKNSTRAQVEHRGVRSDPVTLDVTNAAPALFTQDSSGQGSGAILNQDFSLNDGTRPAAPGSVVLLYATGAGQTTPAGTDGLIASEVLPRPVLNVKVELMVFSGGFLSTWPLKALYAGAAPGLVAGVLQVNAALPANLPAGRHEVILTVGGKMSPTGVTLTVE